MTKYTIEVNTVWKLGNNVLNTRMSIIARNINCVEELPPEDPLYMDGARSRVQLPIGQWVPCANPFEELREAWHNALNESDL